MSTENNAPNEPPHDHDHPPLQHQASVETTGARVDMELTVSAEELSQTIDDVAGIFRQRARVEGFRRGKAPMALIRRRYATDIKERVLEQLVPSHVGHEIRERGLRPIQQPILEKASYEPGAPLRIKVHFDVEQEGSVTGYKDLRATKTVRPVAEDSVGKALGKLRERAAGLEPVESDVEIALGDSALLGIELFPRGGKGRKLHEDQRLVNVGDEHAIPALNTQLEGLTQGATREFVTELGENYPHDLLAGKEVLCKIEVREIRRRVLPPIDDELAKDLGCENLDELREEIRNDYAKHMEQEADEQVVRQLLDEVIGANPVDAPESLIEAHLDRSMQQAAKELASQGVDPRHSVDWASFRQENRPVAERAVQEKILLERIATVEDIDVSEEEVREEIERHYADEAPGAAAGAVRQMRQDGSFARLQRAMVRTQALDLVRRHATITEVGAAAETKE